MLRLMLNNHSKLAIPHESVFITEFFQRLSEYGDLSDRDNAQRLLVDVSQHYMVKRGKLIVDADAILSYQIKTYRDLISAIFQTYASALGKSRWGDKTPSYTSDIDIIRSIFPEAKIIHLVRDGRDVVLSHKSIEWASGNLPKLVLDWKWKTTIAHKVGSVLGDDFLEIRYEDLIRHPEGILRRICNFLHEPYDEKMLNYSEKASELVPAESLKWHRNSILPPDPSQINMWKTRLSKAERIIFEQLAGETLGLFGYELEHFRPTAASRALKVYYTLLKRN
jgi:hypothetical protein